MRRTSEFLEAETSNFPAAQGLCESEEDTAVKVVVVVVVWDKPGKF